MAKKKEWWRKYLSEDGRVLDLCGTEITSLDRVTLPAGQQNLNHFGEEITHLAWVELPQTLQELNLDSTALTNLLGVKLPSGLRKLDLRNTDLSSLAGVKLPDGLQELWLGNTQLTSLAEVEWPKGLKWLDLKNTNLMSLSGVKLPDGLKWLSLRNTDVRSFVDVEFPQELKELVLIGTKLESLAGVDWPQKLQTLYLCGTKLTSLTDAKLPDGLHNLDLRDTELASLLGVKLPRGLKRLWLCRSKLTELPDSVRELKMLETLDLSGLRLDKLPEWLPELGIPFNRNRMGGGICLHNTTIEGVDMSIFDQSQEAILQWFEERKQKGESRLNEIKVVFLGNGDVGKTHTISRLMRDGEKPDSSFTGESTPGIAISDHTYTIDGERIKVHFWDFGGQEIFYSMHRMFLTERTIYVVMVNARDEKRGAQTEEWLDTVKSFTPNAPVLLAVNKLDENPGIELDEPKLREEHPNLKKILYMSARDYDREQFNETFTRAMLELICKSDVPKEKWPTNWKKVKDALGNMEKPYIRRAEYLDICRECDVEQNGELLLNWCNDLGVCYRREDRRLQDYVILRPEWITNAVYTILSNKWDRVRNGILSLEDIFDLLISERSRQVLKDIPYSWPDMDYILGVVRRFSLSYAVDENQEFFPMLCSEKSSEVVKDYVNRADVLEFHMEFPYLPNNVLHRLMVERHVELDSDHVWRTGARFRQIDTCLSAVVRMDDKRLKIYVRSDSEFHAPNTYLSLIAGHVERICGNLNLEIGRRLVIYKEDYKRVELNYEEMKFLCEMGKKEYLSYDLRKEIPLADILKLSGYKVDREREKLLEDLVEVCEMLQGDRTTWNKSEDERTVYIRNLLQAKGYIAACQEPGGESAGGKRAGEQDLVIQREPGRKWTILEALNLDGSTQSYRDYWNKHLDKLLDSYNATGCPFLIHMTYLSCQKDRFDWHCDEFEKHIPRYSPDGFQVTSERVTYPLWDRTGGFMRVMECTYNCGRPVTVYHFFVRIGT